MNVGLIPVRGNSKGIPKKNILLINNKPLVHWVTQAALNSSLDKVFVSTDSEEIKTCVNEIKHPNLIVIGRNQKNATDTASTESVILEFAHKYSFVNIALIQATSPMLKSKHINEAFEAFDEECADSLLTCVKQNRFIWELKDGEASPINYDYNSRPRRQDFDGFLVENGALYITSKKQLLKTGCRLSGKITIYQMPTDTYHEIDEILDWHIVEKIMQYNGY